MAQTMISCTGTQKGPGAPPDPGNAISRGHDTNANSISIPPLSQPGLEPVKKKPKEGALEPSKDRLEEVDSTSPTVIAASATVAKPKEEAIHEPAKKKLKRALELAKDQLEGAVFTQPVDAAVPAVKSEEEAMRAVQKQPGLESSKKKLKADALEPSKDTFEEGVSTSPIVIAASATPIKLDDEAMHATEKKEGVLAPMKDNLEEVTTTSPTVIAASATAVNMNSEEAAMHAEETEPGLEPAKKKLKEGATEPSQGKLVEVDSTLPIVIASTSTAMKPEDESMHAEPSNDKFEEVATAPPIGIAASATAVQSEQEAIHAAETKCREQILDDYAAKLDALWVHPMGPQKETKVFHRVRALLELTSLDESSVCQRTGIPNDTLSQYLHCCLPGPLDEIEGKLDIVFNEFFEGKHRISYSATPGPVVYDGVGAVPTVQVSLFDGEGEGNSIPIPSTCVETVPIPAGTSPLSAAQIPVHDNTQPIPIQPASYGFNAEAATAQVVLLDLIPPQPAYRIPVGVGSGTGTGTDASSNVLPSSANCNPVPDSDRAAHLNDINAQFDRIVNRNSGTWVHPDGRRQVETATFHRACALREVTGMSQTFICVKSGIQNAALSQYLRCRFTGRQEKVEGKLEAFITDYLQGKYYDEASTTRWFRKYQKR